MYKVGGSHENLFFYLSETLIVWRNGQNGDKGFLEELLNEIQ